MSKVKNTVNSRVPERCLKSARFAAIGAGFGALIGKKSALLFGGVGAYLGSSEKED